MTTVRRALASFEGPSLPQPGGRVWLESSRLGPFQVVPAVQPREPAGLTSPMELLAAAYASCLDLTLAHLLKRSGHQCEWLSVSADVMLETAGHEISGIHCVVSGVVPGMTVDELASMADQAREDCPVGKALGGTTFTIDVELS
jgi:lipoyl-dependent peroxiredoxin